MHSALDERTAADLLPGTWFIAATNFPMWLSGQRREPRFSYELVSTDPLVLSDEVSFLTAEGDQKRIVSRDAWKHDEFVRRGKGMLKPLKSRWHIAGAADDGTVLVLRFDQSFAAQGGIDIVVREGTSHPELRKAVARGTDAFGLSPEEFASLTWIAKP
jgi:hypothetical protein